MEAQQTELGAWIGRSETATDVATATPVAALSATLDRPPVRPEAGTPLPPLWHWLYFLPLDRQSDIGPDGHAKRGGFLPPVPLPRRMWAASRFAFHAPLRVGDALTRVSTIEDVSEKTGRTGRLVFVKVRHEIRRGDGATRRSSSIKTSFTTRPRRAIRRRQAGAVEVGVGASGFPMTFCCFAIPR
jgi:3-methylfumaryl-CoA hydratase